MGRPSITQEIAVDADGLLLLWIDGQLFGDETLLHHVRRAALIDLPVPLGYRGPKIVANLTEPVGATAALFAAVPGRTTLLRAPQSVLDLMMGDAHVS